MPPCLTAVERAESNPDPDLHADHDQPRSLKRNLNLERPVGVHELGALSQPVH